MRDGTAIRSETVSYETGARALTLVTTSAALRLQLYSAYLGDEELEEAIVAEVAATPRSPAPELCARRIQVPRDFLLYHRDQALADHLERFVALAAETDVSLELGEIAPLSAVAA
jgi:hypothetical protein